MDRSTGLRQSGWDNVIQAIEILLTTRYFERVLREYVGSPVPALLGELANVQTVIRFQWWVAAVILLFEPRLTPTRISPLTLDRAGASALGHRRHLPAARPSRRLHAGRHRLAAPRSGRRPTDRNGVAMLDLSTLEGLPTPQAITVTSEADALAAIKAVFIDLATSYGLDVTGIIDLEGEPGSIQLQVGAFREVLYRAAINDAVKANLLAFAAGADLDHLAAFYDVIRLTGETDARLRARTVVAISGRSTAGSEDWYKSAAFRASIRVKDVAVYRVGTGPDIRIAVLATDNFGEPDAALLAGVNNEVQKNSVRVISDRVTVVSATSATVNVAADIWLLPTTPITVFDSLETLLRQAMAEEGGLGFNVTRSWLTAKLQAPGVQRVSLTVPVTDTTVDDGAAVKLGTVTLTFKGRDR